MALNEAERAKKKAISSHQRELPKTKGGTFILDIVLSYEKHILKMQ